MSNQYMTENWKKNMLNIWDGEEGRPTYTTRHIKTQEKSWKLVSGLLIK